MTDVAPEDVLHFWFGEGPHTPDVLTALSRRWFAGGEAFDAEIAERFGELPSRAQRGELAAWQHAPRPSLALVIVLDQFPRNLHRGSARSFAYDALALEAATRAIDAGFDLALAPFEASFLYLPFEHAEDLGAQERCVALHRALLERAPPAQRPAAEQSLDYALRHHAIVARFGRFPHRNALLGRTPTEQETAYLEAGGDRF